MNIFNNIISVADRGLKKISSIVVRVAIIYGIIHLLFLAYMYYKAHQIQSELRIKPKNQIETLAR